MDNFFREIDNLKLKPKNRILRGNSGNYRASTIGNSMDFYDHRPYYPNDDIRSIDWKAYMRTNELYVREFIEEKEVHIKTILDNSLSMDFGSTNKFETAKTLALGLGYLTLKQQDVFSFININEEAIVLKENMRGREDIYNLMNQVEKLKCTGKTDYRKICDADNFHGGMTFFISDFLGENLDSALDYLMSRNEETILIHILSLEEIRPDFSGELSIVDRETGETRKVYVNRESYELYRKKLDEFIKDIESICMRRGIKYIFPKVESSPSSILAEAVGVI